MNRFAAFDSDDEQPKAVANESKDKKKVAAAPVAAPVPAAKAPADAKAAAPKKDGEARKKTPKAAGDKPKTPRPAAAAVPEVAAAAPADEGDFEGVVVKDNRNRNKHSQDSIRNPDKRLSADGSGLKINNRHSKDAHARKSKTRRPDPANEIVDEEVDAEKAAEEAATAAKAESAAVPEEPVEEPEPEPVTRSLDEYLSKREAARAASAVLSAAAATRAVDTSVQGILRTEADAGVYKVAAKTNKQKEVKATQRSSGKTVLTDLTFTAEAPEETPRERRAPASGDRSAGRGPRNDQERTPRGDKERAPRSAGAGNGNGAARSPRPPRDDRSPRGKIDIADTNAFPSL